MLSNAIYVYLHLINSQVVNFPLSQISLGIVRMFEKKEIIKGFYFKYNPNKIPRPAQTPTIIWEMPKYKGIFVLGPFWNNLECTLY